MSLINRLRENLSYDPSTGEFTWISSASGRRGGIGARAGSEGFLPNGKRQARHISIFGRKWKEHRLAWFMMTGQEPTFFIDHVNGDPFDNRWENLRRACPSTNAMNRPGDSGRTLPKNVYHCLDAYRVRVMADGERHSFGRYKTVEEAEEAAKKARKNLHGQFSYDT